MSNGAFSAESCWPGVARHATHFLLLRQKKVSKEKATLLSASLALRFRETCGARSSRGQKQLACGSNKFLPWSVWTSAPRRIQKGVGREYRTINSRKQLRISEEART